MLESWANSGIEDDKMVFRARVILAASEGMSNQSIAADLHAALATVGKWRSRFAYNRLNGLTDAPRPGAKPFYDDDEIEKRILEILSNPPPKGNATWTGTLLAEALEDVSVHKVWRILRRSGISLARRHRWCVGTVSEFAPKSVAIVGFFLSPTENAVVLLIDDAPAAESLERARGWVKLSDRRTTIRSRYSNKRQGAPTLVSALKIATELIKSGQHLHNRSHRRKFTDFMDDIAATYAGKDICVILDSLGMYKPEYTRWIQRHQHVRFLHTLTHSSWLNEVEIWINILHRQSAQETTGTPSLPIKEAIDSFLEVFDEEAAPFEWQALEVS
ncbi:MAG: IS630 family transposase [Chloroflexota bacterium]|nr:IS630 family transposase [Chloroflexota bacterium]